MIKQEMIEAIYDKIADKTLSFGCRIVVDSDTARAFEIIISPNVLNEQGKILTDNHCARYLYEDGINIINIIGHPVMIGDVLNWIHKTVLKKGPLNNDGPFFTDIGNIIFLWKDKRKPIEEQPIECIKYIYNLIKE